MPFSKRSITTPRPKPDSYPKELKTIGDHIRAWRIEKRLLQKDIARILGVCEDTVTGWETRSKNPMMCQMPGIFQMLGCFPIHFSVETFGGKITFYRYLKGITPKEFGLLVGADASTVRAWEANKNSPHMQRKKIIENIIEDFDTH